MSEGYKIRSLSEIVNEILSTVRSYYDAEYAYYIEKDRGDIETIYEWCDENIEWQRDHCTDPGMDRAVFHCPDPLDQPDHGYGFSCIPRAATPVAIAPEETSMTSFP